MAKSAWGIELGTSSVKAVLLTGDGGGVSLDTYTIISLADYGLGGGVSREDALAGALSALRVSEGIKRGDQVFVSLTGQNALGRIISLPPVGKERVRETIQNEARSQIPIKLEDAVWDYQVIEGSEDDDELKVNLYAAKKEVVQQLLECCDAAGLQVTGVQVAPLGIYNYIKYEFDDSVSDTCVAIDIGADNTDVVIIDGQKTYVRVVPVAGNDITKALRARFKLSTDDAEKLKRNAAKSKDAAAVFEAMKPPLKDMVGEIYRAVGFYKNQNETANIGKLVMMGNGSKLLNIKKFFEQQLQYEVHRVEAPQRLSLSRNVDPGEMQNTIQSLTVAIGLALQGLGVDGINTINLLPQEYTAGKQVERMRVPFYVGGVLALLGGVIALVLGVLATGNVDGPLGQAVAAKDQASSRVREYTAANDIGDADLKVLSMRNLVKGVVATLERKDADGNAMPPREFTVEAARVPGLIMERTDAAVAQLANDSNSPPVFRVNRKSVQGATHLQGDTHGLLLVQSLPEMRPLTEGARPVWRTKRVFTYNVYVAVPVKPDYDTAAALKDIDRVSKPLNDAITAALRAEWDMSGFDSARTPDIKYNLNVDVVSAQGDAMPINDLIVEGRLQRVGATSPDAIPGTLRYPHQFGQFIIRVTVTLDPMLPDVESAAQ